MGACVKEMMKNLQYLVNYRDFNLHDELEHKIKALLSTAWYDKWQSESDQYHKWLENFKSDEKLDAMFLTVNSCISVMIQYAN